jgi:hypothetical protein
MAAAITQPFGSPMAQTSDQSRTARWKAEWQVDRMTDAKTFVLSTTVETSTGDYEVSLRCLPRDKSRIGAHIELLLTAFTKSGNPRRIPYSPPQHQIKMRFDEHPAFEALLWLSDYSNRLIGGFGEKPMREALASKRILIGNVFPDEIFEVKTGFDQATIDACNQSSGRKTTSEDTGGQRNEERAPKTSATESCLKADDSTPIKIEGILGTSPTITLPNGREYAGYIMTLPKPICADVFMAKTRWAASAASTRCSSLLNQGSRSVI